MYTGGGKDALRSHVGARESFMPSCLRNRIRFLSRFSGAYPISRPIGGVFQGLSTSNITAPSLPPYEYFASLFAVNIADGRTMDDVYTEGGLVIM